MIQKGKKAKPKRRGPGQRTKEKRSRRAQKGLGFLGDIGLFFDV